jgi:hypothetical protein
MAGRFLKKINPPQELELRILGSMKYPFEPTGTRNAPSLNSTFSVSEVKGQLTVLFSKKTGLDNVVPFFLYI